MTEHISPAESARLLRLKDEVARIAGVLARLSGTPAPLGESSVDAQTFEHQVAVAIEARKFRSEYFPTMQFADPAWDILLVLLLAQIKYQRLTVSELCRAVNIPETTAIRTMKLLESRGLVERSRDPRDRRRIFVQLATLGSTKMHRYFARFQHI